MMRRLEIAVAAMLALGLAACTNQPNPNDGIASAQSSGAGLTSTSTGASSGEGGGYDGAKLAKCLRDQGIPADDPGPDPEAEKPRIPESVPKEQIDAAMRHCKQFAPDYGKTAPPLSPDEMVPLRRFAQCMRDQGVEDWPDPGPDGRPLGGPPPPPEDRGKRDILRSAMEHCSKAVPKAGVGVDPDPPTKIEVPGR